MPDEGPPGGGGGDGGDGDGPWALHDDIDQYMISYTDTTVGRIVFRRAGITTVPFETQDFATSPAGGQADHGARFTNNPRGQLEMVFTRTESEADRVEHQVSNDDGDTWELDGTPMFASAKHGHVFHDRNTGILFYSAYRSGAIVARRQYPGDISPGDEFALLDDASMTIVATDDQYCITSASDSVGRWLLTVLVGGEVTVYESYDDGETWKGVA